MSKSFNKVREQFNRRYAAGEQNLYIDKETHKILEKEKNYYWQRTVVYNKILPMIESLSAKINMDQKMFDKIIYGVNGFVERLIPYQSAYNDAMNHRLEDLNKLRNRSVFVEDGSVDVDELTEEGEAPGKIIIYRQGSTAPQIEQFKSNDIVYQDVLDDMMNEMQNIYKHFLSLYSKYIVNNSMMILRPDGQPRYQSGG